MKGEASDRRKGKALLSDQETKEGQVDLEMNQLDNQKISVIPDHVKNNILKAYEPKQVSIGPYHHGKPQLLKMEIHKQRALDNLVRKSKLLTPQSYMVELKKHVKTLKMCYENLDLVKWEDDDAFIKLMVLDGCFLIEFLCSPYKMHSDYPDDDPIFGKIGHAINKNSVMQDLLMVENQLPFLAVKALWLTCGKDMKREEGLIIQRMKGCIGRQPGFHMLDTHMEGLLKVGDDRKNMHDGEVQKRCASELYKCNVQFKRADSYDQIKFDSEKGVLFLPVIIIDECTATIFLNMVVRALRCASPAAAAFTIYARLLDTLVQSTKDVKFLQSSGIIMNELSNEEAVLEVIRDISKGPPSPDDLANNLGLSYKSLVSDLDEFCEKKSNKLKKTLYVWLSHLMETHFKTPWSGLSLGAAVALLTLTLIQTIFAILAYRKQ